MKPTLHAFALCALGLALQAGRSQEPDPAPAPASEERKLTRAERLRKEFLGLWRLERIESNSLRGERRSETGLLLADKQHLSFEAHMAWQDSAGFNDAMAFFTGTHRYSISNEGTIVMTSLIGTTVEQGTARPIFEPPGRAREYMIDITEDRLTLSRRSDGQKFLLVREGAETGLDFYGRRKKPKEAKGTESGG
jgi:hypothetical protein